MEPTAAIYQHDRWWLRYEVVRRLGVFIPEREFSSHWTRRGAQHAAHRWTRTRSQRPAEIARYP